MTADIRNHVNQNFSSSLIFLRETNWSHIGCYSTELYKETTWVF